VNGLRVNLAALLILVFLPVFVFASGDRIDMRVSGDKVSSRLATPRLALGGMKEKSKEEELQVKKKKKVSSVTKVVKVKRFDNQRKRKTKRVVASQ
jgi:hypothetical protein